ncbi:ankyrin repeat-containing domain protein [Bisporella sp. PMI_857]|nr:ankyrin repeat-containing domain protein [Bisporella sp. PMI_857]
MAESQPLRLSHNEGYIMQYLQNLMVKYDFLIAAHSSSFLRSEMASNSSEPLVAAIREFKAVLTPAQSTELLAHSSKPDATSILTFTAEVDRLNADRRSRGVSSRLFGILQSVQSFSAIVDTFVSSHPNVAALVWGTVKFTILAANNVTSFFDKLSECFLRLRNYCPRYSEYQLLFGDSTRLQKALCSFYATIVNFCTRAIQAIKTPGPTLAKALWRPFEKEFGAFEDGLRKQNENVREEIKLAGEQAAAREREAAAKERNSGSLFRTEVKQISREAQERRLQRDQQRAKVEREKLLEKLSVYDYIGALKRMRKKRHGTTSSWLSETKAFKDWLKDINSSTLWLSGILGSGKSVVTAAAIDGLLCRPWKGNDHTGFFFCEFDNASSLTAWTILGTLIRQCLSTDTLSKTIEDRLKELFKGFSPDAEDLEPLLHDIAATSRTVIFVIDGFDECAGSARILILRILHRLMSSSRSTIKIFFSSREDVIGDIVRVFDTCQQVTMDCKEASADIPTYVNSIVAEKIGNGELVIDNTQLIQDIQNELVKGANGMFLWVAFQVQDLCRQKCDADIRRCLTSLPKDLPDTYEHVLSRIIKDGNAEIVDKIFRWIAAAKRPLLLEELREALAIGSGDAYLQWDRRVNNADRIIPWCASLVVLDEEDLVVQFAHHSVIQFLLSKEYSVATKRFHFQVPEVNHVAGEICVTYLNFNDFKLQMTRLPRGHQAIQPKDLVPSGQNRVMKYGLKLAGMATKKSRVNFDVMQQLGYTSGKDSIGLVERIQTQYSFLAYASEFWLSHTAGFRETTPTYTLWKQLVFAEHPLAMKPWTIDKGWNAKRSITNYILNESHYALITCFRDARTVGIPLISIRDLLIMASDRGNAQVVEFILGFNDSAESEITKSLRAAARGGHLEIVERLLIAKANVNAVAAYNSGRTALQAAAGCGHLEVVERLLTAKANINAVAAKNSGRTALQAAAEGGHLEVVERLLIEKANVNAVAAYNSGRTALQAAAEGGHLEVVERLLTAKANVNAAVSGCGGCTALQAAAEGGHLGIVERLLTAKADVNAAVSGYGGRTALQAAAEGGHLEIVERLLTAKADVNAAAYYSGHTALQAAAGCGHLEIVERLLTAKADVNAAAANDSGRTALQAAAGCGHLGIVERLLTAKADVNAAVSGYGGRTALQAAAEGGHLEIVERLLTAKADVNAAAANDSGRTALQAAAGCGHLEVVERLLTAKANVNAAVSGYGGRTALQAAAEGGNLEVVERLLTAKANVNAVAAYDSGRTALQAAAEGGHLEIVERLLTAKANINAVAAKNSGSTALQAAAGCGHLEIVERLLTAKADVNAVVTGYSGRTALQAAAEGGHLKVVERLLTTKADVNAAAAKNSGRTALQAAVGCGNLEIVERLLTAKANVNATAANDSGRTALQAAAEGGHLEVVERLLTAKANVNAAVSGYGGCTALQAAAGGGHLEIVERLLTAKADVNAAANDSGRTALQAAAGCGHLGIVERLLTAKADVNAAVSGYGGRTALQAAAGCGHLEIVERLLTAKANVNATAAYDSGRTALQAAAEGGHLEIVERLLTAKADVNAAAANDSGRTALQAAAEGGHLEIVERLLTAKADVNAAAANDSGRTALQAAAEGGHVEVVQCLKDAGARF